MSDREYAKKASEERDLLLFLHEHERVTGVNTHIVSSRERPDFEVERESKIFGVELVQVVESPETRLFSVIMDGHDEMTVSDASDAIQNAIYKKEEKRVSEGWALPDNSILIVQLRQCPGEDIFHYWDDTIFDEVCGTGFAEIWLSDHTPEEPYGTVEIAGIKPARWRGVHRHSLFGTKPYG
ncbi:MAG TPA: hypothetical protein PLB55_11895 [Prosthecobacter sp.]|nr:hypothetical protein [Prosthecobacter sp.]